MTKGQHRARTPWGPFLFAFLVTLELAVVFGIVRWLFLWGSQVVNGKLWAGP